MTRLQDDKLGFLGIEGISLGQEVEVPEILRISNKDFNNFRQRHVMKSSQLDSDCWKSLSRYAEMIHNEGGISTLEKVEEDRIGGDDTFFFSFSTSWQVEVPQKYNSVVFLDSTHNTCVPFDERNRKSFLYTIIAKHDGADCGIPVAFMVTNSETQKPLTRWLAWVKQSLHLPTSIIFMIDCSATEMAAIETVFGYSQIRLYHWHMLRAMRTQVSKKICIPVSESGASANQSRTEVNKQIRKSAIDDFLQLIHSRSAAENNRIWENYTAKFSRYVPWISYIESTWLKHAEKWWAGNRIGMLSNNTNNYVESWHNMLKSGYLGNSRKNRTDVLIDVLLREVLPDFRLKVARVSSGMERRKLSVSEKCQLGKCNALDFDTALSKICHSVFQSGENYSEVFLVKSFYQRRPQYIVSQNAVSAICRYSCKLMVTNNTVCKHMFPAQRTMGHSICFETRLGGDSANLESQIIYPDSQPTLKDDNFGQDSYDCSMATFSGSLKSFNSYINKSKELGEDIQGNMLDIAASITAIKRKFDAKGKSWAKKQRR